MDIEIKLIINDFVNSGKCVYEDLHGNKLQMFRKDTGDRRKSFSAKLRFINKNVRADALRITLPLDESENGENLHIEYLDGIDHGEDEDVKNAILMITEITQRWIVMLNAISYLDAPEELIMKANPYMTKNQIAEQKASLIADYEELSDLYRFLMGDLDNPLSHV